MSARLAAIGLTSFVASYTKTSRWSDRIRRVSCNVFPGYLFCRFLARDFPRVRQVSGILYAVPVGCPPIAIPDAEIENLRRALTQGLHLEPVRHLETGDLVEVTNGSLKGLVGRLIRRGNRSRLVISIDILQRGVATDVHEEDVSPVRS